MYHLVGTILIVSSAVLALMAGISYILTIRGNRAARTYARVGVFGSLFIVAAIWLLLVALFLTRRFDVEYVYTYSSSNLNTFLTIAATWAGQPGSFAIWVLFNGIVAALLVRKTRHHEPYVLAILMLLQASITAFMLVSNPFNPMKDPNTGMVMFPPPNEGQGLNPLLDNFWMIFHPPVLFVGYALAAVPFAFALAGLLRHDYDGWLTHALPWTLLAWAFLGLALFLGAYWAYETLGWGGYWGWDPVENSSLVPWLLLSALLHSMLVQRTHKSLRRTNFSLAILTYLSVIYATYLTRSGVLTNFSVHSFVSAGLNEAMIGFQIVLIIVCLIILALRWRDIPTRPLQSNFFSRDTFMVLTVLTLVVIALVVTFGTSMPVISAIPGVGHSLQDMLGASFEIDDGSALGGEPLTDGRFSLMPEFFKQTTPPLGLVMMILLIIGPLTSWRSSNDTQQALLQGLRWPFVATIAAAIIALLLGVRDPLGLAFIAVSVFAAGTNILVLLRNARISWRNTGAQVTHLGLSMMIIGIVGSSMYASPDERVVMSAGETVSIYGFDITFNKWEATRDQEGNPDGKGVLDLTVQHSNETFRARPQLYFDQSMGSTMQTPAIKSYVWRDLYIAPAEYIPENNPNKPVVQADVPQKVGPYTITFQNFEIDDAMLQDTGIAKVGANMSVIYEGKAHTVMPQVTLEADEEALKQDSFTRIPAIMPGGHKVVMTMFEPSQRLVLLEIEGLDLPVTPARAVITVSTKPIVFLVWTGVIVGVLGGIIAWYRRYVEGTVMLRSKPVHLPQGVIDTTSR